MGYDTRNSRRGTWSKAAFEKERVAVKVYCCCVIGDLTEHIHIAIKPECGMSAVTWIMTNICIVNFSIFGSDRWHSTLNALPIAIEDSAAKSY